MRKTRFKDAFCTEECLFHVPKKHHFFQPFCGTPVKRFEKKKSGARGDKSLHTEVNTGDRVQEINFTFSNVNSLPLRRVIFSSSDVVNSQSFT